jgi:aerobic carbon-monoxide dehydrogenase medium subunit
VIPARVDYLRPTSIGEALEALADGDAKVLAGGHSLVPMMKLRLARPMLLVDIGRLELRGISESGGVLTIGALTTYDQLLRTDGIGLPDALRESAAAVGDVQVRNMGTVGGSVAHGDPASDVTASLIALGASLRLRSAAGVRECPADEFFVGLFTTVLRQQEILVEIDLPLLGPGEGSAYRSVDDAASGYPLAGAAARVRLDDGRVAECAVGLTGAEATPRRLREVEQALLEVGSGPVEPCVGAALAKLELTRGEGDSEYRRQLTVVAVTRAFQTARARAVEGET